MSIFKKGRSTLDSDLTPEFDSMANKVADENVEPQAPNLQTTKKSNTGKVGVYILLLFALIGLIVGIIVFFGNSDSKIVEQQKETTTNRVVNTKPKQFNLERERDPEPAPEPASTQADAPTQIEQAWQENQKEFTQADTAQEFDRRLTGSVLLPVDSSPSRTNQESTGETHSTPLSNRLQPTVTASTKAKRRFDMTYLMKKGTNIGCTLDTKIVTTHPGITRCLVTKDVYSADGEVLLVERGSEIIGEQTTSMLQGQAKVFVLWNTITTPHGVTLDIASPSADSLGASGQDAQVDRHFWERFGGAIMLSLVDDGLVIIGDRINRNNNTVTYNSTSDTIESMAAEALRNTINIPPTGYVNQGTLLNVMVARDVDFSEVYELVTPYFY